MTELDILPKGGLPWSKYYGNIESAGFAFPGDVSLTLNMTNTPVFARLLAGRIDLPKVVAAKATDEFKNTVFQIKRKKAEM